MSFICVLLIDPYAHESLQLADILRLSDHRFQREAGEARTEVEVLKRQIPSFFVDERNSSGVSKGDSGSDLSLQRRLAAKEVAAGLAREAKEMAEVEASKLQAALDESRREVRDVAIEILFGLKGVRALKTRSSANLRS